MLRRRRNEEPTPEGPFRVLVVNDDEDACELVCRILARAGYEVDRAGSHEHALTRLNVERPDCVMLDLSTGDIGQNLALLDKIRSQSDNGLAATRVLLVAQHVNNQMFSWQAGIDAFLVRPFFADDLLREIGDAVERPDEDRPKHRRRRLDAAAAEGR